MEMKKNIRRVLKEETIKKFNKGGVQRGKFSDALEKLAIAYIGEKNVCDVVAVFSDGLYVIMVLYNGSSPWTLDNNLNEFIRKILPLKLFTMVTDTQCNNE